MTRRRPPLAERRPASPARDIPGHLATHLPAAPDLALRIGGDGVVLGIDPHGGPLSVRLFHPTPPRAPARDPARGTARGPARGTVRGTARGPVRDPAQNPSPHPAPAENSTEHPTQNQPPTLTTPQGPTRAVLVGSPACAQLVAYRALATGAQVLIRTNRPTTWTPLAVPSHPVDATPATHPRRTQPLLYIDDAPSHSRPPELPDSRWTTVLTLREALTHQDAGLVEHADVLLLQPLRPTEVDILKARGVDHRLTQLPADVLTVVDRHGLRWGRLAVTPIEQHYFGAAPRN